MALASAEICAVIAEIRPVLVGGLVQKVFQPGEYGIVLKVRIPGRTVFLCLSAQPETARIHLQKRQGPNPPRPPAFCQLLRSKIQGARIEDVRQHGQDRIVEILLQAKNTAYYLIGELIGRGATILLSDSHGTVLAGLRPARERLKTPLASADRAAADSHDQQRFPPAGAGSADEFPISAAIEAHYGERERVATLTSTQQQRLSALRRSRKKFLRRVEALEGDMEKARRYHAYARYGELLKANLAQLRKGQAQATVIDYFDETLPTLSLPLDPAKSPQANMDDYFHKHRKFLTALREVAPRIGAAKEELARADAEILAIERGDWRPPTDAPLHEPLSSRRRMSGSPGTRPDKRKGPFRRFHSAEGIPIYVGRTAKENEELTHRFANSEDLWLHARGVPGSHVVVRLPKGAELPPETLRDAATLALLYSDLKKSGRGDVIFTRKKWVRKAKGQAPGAVLVTQDKSIFVQLDRERLARLKESDERKG